MSRFQNYNKEIIITVIAFVWLLFTSVNVNQTLGNTYLWFNGIGLFLLIVGILSFGKKIKITFQKQPGGTLKSIGWGFAGWVILLSISVLVMKFVDPAEATIGSVIVLMGATTPALATSKILNWLNFGVVIPYTETQLWARLQEFFADVFHINLNKRNLRAASVIVLIGLLALAFAIFHITAKGVTSFASLTVVFIMMSISLVYVVYFGESRQAFWLHCFANGVAAYLMLFG